MDATALSSHQVGAGIGATPSATHRTGGPSNSATVVDRVAQPIIKQTPEEPTNYGRMAFTMIVMPFLFIWFLFQKAIDGLSFLLASCCCVCLCKDEESYVEFLK